MSVTAADIGLGLIIGISSLWGYQSGLIRDLLSIVTIVAAAVVGFLVGPELGAYVPIFGLQDSADPGLGANLQRVLGIGIAFGACYLAGWFVLYQIQQATDDSWIGAPNQTLGAFFGLVRGAVIVIVIILFLDPSLQEHSWWQDSFLVGLLLPFTDEVIALWNFLLESIGITTK